MSLTYAWHEADHIANDLESKASQMNVAVTSATSLNIASSVFQHDKYYNIHQD